MHVKEANLRDCLWPNVMVVFVLRTGFKTTAAGHAARISIELLNFLLVHAWPWPKIVRAVKFDPRMNSLEVIEHLGAVDHQVANIRKLGHWLELDRLFQIINQRRA